MVTMVLVLDDAAVRQAIDMAGAIEAIEQLCHEEAAGTALGADRVNLKLPTGWLRLMPGALLGSGVLGYKQFHLVQHDVRYAMHLFDAATGAPLAILDAKYLTALRTGAAGGVATKYLAPDDASRAGVIGSGAEARVQFEAAAAVRPLRQARVYSRDPGRRGRFAQEMTERFGVEVTPVGTPQEALADAETVIAATNTVRAGPALLGAWLRPGLHVTSIGSTLPEQREIDPDVWRAADRIVVDTPQVLTESGDGIAAEQAGAIDHARVAPLHAVVTGQAPGRASAEELTLYKSVGTGLQDVAVAWRIYERARALGLGTHQPAVQSVKHVEG